MILTAYQSILGYFIPRGQRITFIVRSYLHFFVYYLSFRLHILSFFSLSFYLSPNYHCFMSYDFFPKTIYFLVFLIYFYSSNFFLLFLISYSASLSFSFVYAFFLSFFLSFFLLHLSSSNFSLIFFEFLFQTNIFIFSFCTFFILLSPFYLFFFIQGYSQFTNRISFHPQGTISPTGYHFIQNILRKSDGWQLTWL